MSECLLYCSEIVSGYGDALVLHGVGLKVRAGTITALVGANGAGKSTLMRTLIGLLPLRSGSILYRGQELGGSEAADRVAAGIALVPEGRLVFPDLTVEQNLYLGAYTPRARTGRATRIREMYNIFERLRERRAQAAGTLSGGEQQMLALARGLMSDPALLLLDEPSLGLAPQMVRQVFESVVRIRDRGIAILIVEQDVAGTLGIADYAYLMENGRITKSGDAASMRNDPEILASYLGG
ncbi:MAG TPA: ABC transporter ATP-binding protein [Burkholderiaceae bacterium]|nr:ABC transporter ATP-binding protein [Burkholderiaceae bacterium]